MQNYAYFLTLSKFSFFSQVWRSCPHALSCTPASVYMLIIKDLAQLRQHLDAARQQGGRIGFVPTMGALHSGHISLAQQSKQENDLTLVSIFVNPAQFGPNEDYQRYPRQLEADAALLEPVAADIVFAPDVATLYPEDYPITVALPDISQILCGRSRPTHFAGVALVLAKFLAAIRPHSLYMGQKDYQQCMVITRLLEQLDKKDEIKMMVCPTTREADGLAMSSRNRRLTEPQRAIAGLLYQCLVSIQAKKDNTPFAIVQKECNDILTAKSFEPGYIALADARDLTLLDEYDNTRPMIALIAAKIGGVRLIDNLLLN